MTRRERPEVLLRKLLEADGIEIIIRKCKPFKKGAKVNLMMFSISNP